MSDLQKLQNQIKDKLLLGINEGMVRFPILDSSFIQTHSQVEEKESPFLNISKCTACSLSDKRKRVLVESKMNSKPFFVISDFPDTVDEASDEVFSILSPISSILLNLLNKLNILNSCHFSFAIKCVPERGLPENAISACSLQNLSQEIFYVEPKIILCFGYRALQSLVLLDKNLNSSDFLENSEMKNMSIGGLSIRVFFLSSIRDLRDFPHWRRDVWNVLQPLVLKANL